MSSFYSKLENTLENISVNDLKVFWILFYVETSPLNSVFILGNVMSSVHGHLVNVSFVSIMVDI